MGTRRSRIHLPPDQYKKLCLDVFKRDGWKCRCCKRRSNLHAHHIIFRSQGGDDITSNLLTLCETCHDGIHRPHPFTGACLVVISRSEAEVIDADNMKDTGFLFVNNFSPRRAA